NELINELTQFIQKRQRETGKSFVSRTRLNPDQWQRMNTIVFRVVLANPLTTNEILSSVLDEQREIAKQAPNLMKRIQQLVVDIQSS
ncbi:putative pyridoxal-dependent aspartate 1-decarboxylase, partial [Vibrio parahaemolyticus]|nr:putative pyridoxal-dependent aspartate 1-decarboxylase [Vibrio parahaemolyticus]